MIENPFKPRYGDHSENPAQARAWDDKKADYLRRGFCDACSALAAWNGLGAALLRGCHCTAEPHKVVKHLHRHTSDRQLVADRAAYPDSPEAREYVAARKKARGFRPKIHDQSNARSVPAALVDRLTKAPQKGAGYCEYCQADISHKTARARYCNDACKMAARRTAALAS
jgi:hypothetical protein